MYVRMIASVMLTGVGDGGFVDRLRGPKLIKLCYLIDNKATSQDPISMRIFFHRPIT